MNVVVNGRFLNRRVTGVERYGREILRRLGNRLRVVRSERWADGVRGHLWEQLVLPGQIGPNHILWSPANTGPLQVEPQVLTLHDLSPLEHPEWFRPAFGLWYRLFVPVLVKKVRRVVVSSEFVRKKLLKRFGLSGERVNVIHGGVDMEFFCPGTPQSLNLPQRYILFVGSLQPRKNLPRLFDAWKQIVDAVPDTWMVIAGVWGEVFRPVQLAALDRVKFLGAVSEADLPGLYANAALFVLPSLDEGFGLPVLEAMSCGAPVAVSNAGAIPDVVVDAGLMFNPMDTHEITETLFHGLTDKTLRAALREKGLMRASCFSWQSSAEKMWEVFEQCQ